MKLNKIFRQNNFWLSLITIVAVGLAIPAFGAYAGLSEYIGKFIFYILFFPFIALFKLELIILPIIAQFNNFTHLEGIVTGWKILRDLSNMFFIVVLLFMAFATILKISSYGYKELLKTLIIMAILINFSKTIAGFMIDIGQVVMLTFVAAIKDVAAGNLTAMFGVDDMVNLGNQNGEPTIADGSQIVLAYLLGGVMMMLAAIVLMAFLVMLVMRIIYLWFLVIVSPLAFLANTFPSTKKYFSEWLSYLGKEIIVGPVLIFFLWLSLTIMNSEPTKQFTDTSIDSQKQGQKSLIGKDANISFTAAGQWDNVLKYIIALGMLIASLGAAKKIGSSAMAYGDKAAAKLKSTASSAYKFAGNRAWTGSTGEGGLKLGLRRAGTAVVAPRLEKLGDRLPAFAGGFAIRGAAVMRGSTDKAMQKKQKKIEERYENVRDEDKEKVLASRGGSYSKRALDKIQVGKKNKLKGMEPEEIKAAEARFRQLNDVEGLRKLQNAHGIANSEWDVKNALETGRGLELYQNSNMGGTFEKDENDRVVTAKEGSAEFAQGQMLAKGFLQLTQKEQSQALDSMDKDSAEAMIQYVMSLKPADIKAVDSANGEKEYTTVHREEVRVTDEPVMDESTGKQKVGADGKPQFKTITETKTTREENQETIAYKRMALLQKHKPNNAVAEEAYQEVESSTRAAIKRDGKDEGSFDKEATDKSLAKNATGKELAQIDFNGEVFKRLAKYLKPAQISDMQAAGASASSIAKVVEIQARAVMASGSLEKQLVDIKRLLASSLTRDFVPEDIVEKLGLSHMIKNRQDEEGDDKPSNNAVPSSSTPKPEESPILDQFHRPFKK